MAFYNILYKITWKFTFIYKFKVEISRLLHMFTLLLQKKMKKERYSY